MNKSAKSQILYSVLGVALVFILWLTFYLIVRNEYLIPTPFAVLEKAGLLLFELEFYSALLSTLLRVLLATAISLIVAIVLAVLCVFFKGLNSVLTPITACLRALPTLAVLLLILPAHEFAHGYAAYKMGDLTPKISGRLTINPLKHLDFMGFLCFMFLILYVYI